MIPLLQVQNLKKEYQTSNKHSFSALHDLTFDLYKGETLGLVGESGCGKSTAARCLLALEAPTGGSIHFNGENIFSFGQKKLIAFRKQAQMIFQNPYAALNPRMTALNNIAEPLRIHTTYSEGQIREEVINLLELVGLCRSSLEKYPHEFSGGQRQRIMIARGIALKPQLIICDEPLSSLDTSVQAQIVNLLKQLQKELRLTYLFIAHDLKMVRYISDRIAVMHQGTIVECSPTDELFAHPNHPHTKNLISALL